MQSLLSLEERTRFDQSFLGVMGIDLGIGDGHWHRFVNAQGNFVSPTDAQTVDYPEGLPPAP